MALDRQLGGIRRRGPSKGVSIQCFDGAVLNHTVRRILAVVVASTAKIRLCLGCTFSCVTEVRWVMQVTEVKYMGDAGKRGDAGKVGNAGNSDKVSNNKCKVGNI